uniref:ABC-type glutathione-S-conjugate transporter n=1 Tax=Phallusia mammillata TaxID=59560 RepID=A0A6F9D605_9ASCI|nr:multidrug resistance-associated protein 1-like [Phallusia mammillata]
MNCSGGIYNMELHLSNATLPSSFQQLSFHISPCAILWLFALPYHLHTRKSTFIYLSVSKLFKAKLLSTLLVWILSWAELLISLLEWSWNNGNFTVNDLIVPTVISSTMGLVVILLHFDQRKGIHSSGLLSVFWFIGLLLWALVCHYKVLYISMFFYNDITDIGFIKCIMFFISYAAVILNFILSFISDRPATKVYDGAFLIHDNGKHDTADKFAKHKPSPKNRATFYSKMFYQWFTKFALVGYRRTLIDTDLWKLDLSYRSNHVTKQFLKHWNAKTNKKTEYVNKSNNKNTQGGRTRLLWTICKTFGPYFLFGSLLKFVLSCLNFARPQILGALISFTAQDVPLWQGYFWAISLFVAVTIWTIILQQHMYICASVGMKLRSALIGSIYRKILCLSNAARKENTVGGIVNLVSVDTQNLRALPQQLDTLWAAPLQIILAIYFLWQELGPSVIAGVAVMVFLIPVNALIVRKSKSLQLKQMEYKDARMKFMSEVLSGIKVLKMYAWELSFQDKITEVRNKELKQLRRFAYLNAATTFTFVCVPVMVSLVTFAVYVLSDKHNILDARKIFVSLSLFDILRGPLSTLPSVISSVVQAGVSLRRIDHFLNQSELDELSVDRRNTDSDNAITVRKGCFQWEPGNKILKEITMSVPVGSLVAVVGQIGCGKSSLVSALLGNMDKRQGYVAVRGSIAYVPQQAWIQNLSVRDNITFGKKLDVCRYEEIVEACELKLDFSMLPAGDQTEIGERGINLSGGQKQRVAIARAVYQDKQIYLFDDPLSSVDSHVEKRIFENVIGPNGCLKSKTRLLVTHGLTHLSQVDKIYVLKNGMISEVGHYYELLNKNGYFAEFLKTYSTCPGRKESAETTGPNVEVTSISSQPPSDIESENGKQVEKPLLSDSCCGFESKQSLSSVHHRREPFSESKEENKSKNSKRKLITKEKMEIGSVKSSFFISYLRSVGFLLSLLICFFYVLQNIAMVYSRVWLSEWSDDPVTSDGTQNGTETRLLVYSSLGLVQASLVVVALFTMTYGSVTASAIMHANLLHRILRAPMHFFHTTPLGRLLNRFSQDIQVVDKAIPATLHLLLMNTIQAVGSFAVIIYITPLFAVVLGPLLLFYYFIQCFYTRTLRQLKRLESVYRSPIFSHFAETITGVTTIRAYDLQKTFISDEEFKFDQHQMALYVRMISNRWIGVQLQLVGNFIVLFASLFAVNAKGSINAGTVGLSVSYAILVTNILKRLVRQACMLEANVVSIERILEYSNVVQEAPLYLDRDDVPPEWPSRGQIDFQGYSTKYQPDLEFVVQDITASIAHGEKIGVVGRTGAGKSSLTLGIFRIIEAFEGTIKIDGKDIKDVGLYTLRSKLSIIPQDPVLFCGSLRMNLDPFDVYSDEQLWSALEHSHLKNFVVSLPLKLDHKVSEGGDNLSVGQRQLICLARALLRKSKILILDEATAAVDLETDDLIQTTIRSEFCDSTTITIAHRLNTIMDSDRDCSRFWQNNRNGFSRRTSKCQRNFFRNGKRCGIGVNSRLE